MTTPFDTLSPEQAALLRRTVTRQLSDDEHALFLETAQRSGLDPFARHIYPLRKDGKLKIEATIDGLRFSAERTGKYAGQLGPEWCGSDGKWRDIWTSDQPHIQLCDPERGDASTDVPSPLQPFFDQGLSNRRNLQAAYGFVQLELEHVLGTEGLPVFRKIYARHMGHGLFTSRSKCEAANRACLIELWGSVEAANRERRAA